MISRCSPSQGGLLARNAGFGAGTPYAASKTAPRMAQPNSIGTALPTIFMATVWLPWMMHGGTALRDWSRLFTLAMPGCPGACKC